MLDSFKQKLTNNSNLNTIIQQISQPSLIHNFSSSHLEELAKIVQGKQGNYKLHPKIITTIYSILIMKDYENYNTKLAIESLSKYYRSLMPTHGHDTHETNKDQKLNQDTTFVTNKTRTVIANLLIRIPTFSNYKLILRDITPQLLPHHIILEHRDKIYKQCPNIYKEHLIKQHKHTWYQLIQGDQSNFPLHLEFKALRTKVERTPQVKNVVELYKIHEEMEKQVIFLRNRINSILKQEIDIEETFNQIKSILTYSIPNTIDRKLLLPQVLSKQQYYIRNIKTSTLQLLRLIISKLNYKIYRKFDWISSILDELFNRPYDAFSINPAYLIFLLSTTLQVYGLGFFNFDKIVHNENASSLFNLVSALAYNDYSKNNKNEELLVNYQNKAKNTKQKNNIHINLFNTTLVDTAYEPYLKKTTQYERELLMNRVLQFLQGFYGTKLKLSAQFYHSTQIMGVLSTSKNEISKRNKDLIQKIKKQILFQGYRQIGQNFESFCEHTFNAYIKRRSERKLDINRLQQIFIQPTVPNKDGNISKSPIADSYVSFSSKQVEVARQSKLKKTNSFDMELQGWGNHKDLDKSQKKVQKSKSEMFYSIKECSPIQQKDEGKISMQRERIEEQEKQFILTPQF